MMSSAFNPDHTPFCVFELRWQANKSAWAESHQDALLYEQQAIEAELEAEAAAMDAPRKATEAAMLVYRQPGKQGCACADRIA